MEPVLTRLELETILGAQYITRPSHIYAAFQLDFQPDFPPDLSPPNSSQYHPRIANAPTTTEERHYDTQRV